MNRLGTTLSHGMFQHNGMYYLQRGNMWRFPPTIVLSGNTTSSPRKRYRRQETGKVEVGLGGSKADQGKTGAVLVMTLKEFTLGEDGGGDESAGGVFQCVHWRELTLNTILMACRGVGSWTVWFRGPAARWQLDE